MNMADFINAPRRGQIDPTGPVIRLDNLSRHQFGQLLDQLSLIYQGAGAR